MEKTNLLFNIINIQEDKDKFCLYTDEISIGNWQKGKFRLKHWNDSKTLIKY